MNVRLECLDSGNIFILVLWNFEKGTCLAEWSTNGLYHKTFYGNNAIMNDVACQASVYVIVGHFFLALTNTLAYYGRELITTVKSYMIQSPMSLTLNSLLTLNRLEWKCSHESNTLAYYTKARNLYWGTFFE